MSTEEGKAKRLANLMPPWKKGQSGNPKGLKPLTIQGIVRQLKKEGYKEFTKNDVSHVYLYCMGLGEERMKSLLNDKETPFLIRLCIKSLLSKKGFEYAEKMLDRALGKVGDKLDITTDGEKLKQEPLSIRFVASKEDLAKIEQEVPDVPDGDS